MFANLFKRKNWNITLTFAMSSTVCFFAFFANCKWPFMCLSLRRGFRLATLPSSVECCSDGYPSGSFSHLHTGSLDWTGVAIGFLVTSLTKALLPRLLSLAASSRKSPGCSKPLPFKNFGGHCALGNLQCGIMFFEAFPRSVPRQYCVSSAGGSFDIMAWFFFSDKHC